MLTWEELKEEAKKVLANEPTGDFEDVSFGALTGGAPANNVGVKEVSGFETRSYDTVSGRWCYKGEVVVRCRKTGVKDKRGLDIYEAEDGLLFVYIYRPGSPEFFDSGKLVKPAFTL